MLERHHWTRRWVFGAFAILTATLSSTVAQEAPPAPTGAAPQVQSETKTKKADTPPDAGKPQNDRIFFALPNYLTVENSESLPPLTTKQKFQLQALGVFDPVELTYIGLAAGINQVSNSEPAYGQGFAGYAKRYGTSFGDTVIGNFMTGAVFPTLLRQDPRYYQMGSGRFLHRAAYAACRVFVTRSDSGHKEFNFSELLGNGVAAGIANAYHPAPRTFMNSVSIWGTQIAWDATNYELKEFWPDIHRAMRRHASPPSPQV